MTSDGVGPWSATLRGAAHARAVAISRSPRPSGAVQGPISSPTGEEAGVCDCRRDVAARWRADRAPDFAMRALGVAIVHPIRAMAVVSGARRCNIRSRSAAIRRSGAGSTREAHGTAVGGGCLRLAAGERPYLAVRRAWRTCFVRTWFRSEALQRSRGRSTRAKRNHPPKTNVQPPPSAIDAARRGPHPRPTRRKVQPRRRPGHASAGCGPVPCMGRDGDLEPAAHARKANRHDQPRSEVSRPCPGMAPGPTPARRISRRSRRRRCSPTRRRGRRGA